jgi:AbrB family looped-hinge helix DNA binding protein
MTPKYATVSSKGQITLPAEARRALDIKKRERVRVEVEDDAIVIRRVGNLLDLEGFLGEGASPEEERKAMMEAVSRHVLGLDEEDE